MKRFVSPLPLHEASERLLSIHGGRLPGIWPIGVRTANTSPTEQNFTVYGEEDFFPPFTVRLQSEADATHVHILTRSIWINRFTLSLAALVITVTAGTYLGFGDVLPAIVMMLIMSIGMMLFGYILLGIQFELVRLIRYMLSESVTELDSHFWRHPSFNWFIPGTLQTAQSQLETIKNFKVNHYHPSIRFWHPHPTGQRYDIDLKVIYSSRLKISIELDGYLHVLDNGYTQIIGRWKVFWLSKVLLLFYFALLLYGILHLVLELITENRIPNILILIAGIIGLSWITWDIQRAKNKLIALIKERLAEIPGFSSINSPE